MTYKQALYFIGKCLTLSHYPERIIEVSQQILSSAIDWKKIVRVSSGHMVLPAFYLSLKRVKLSHLLPQDLVAYCEEITHLNRERNKAIIKQAKKISLLLRSQDITAIFLKGTAHLLEGLYTDIGARMVGDIDFIVAENQLEKAAQILIKKGYKPMETFISTKQFGSKHYPRLTHPTEIGAVEIHWAVVLESHKTNLSYQNINQNKQQFKGLWVPSFKHQAIHNMLNTQINDHGFLYGKIMMRQMYDGYLLGLKPDVMEAYQNYNYDFYRKSVYLNLIEHVFKPNVTNKSNRLNNISMWRYDLSLNWPRLNYIVNYTMYFIKRIFSYPKTIILAIYKKEVRLSLYRRLSDKTWYGKHLRSYKYQ